MRLELLAYLDTVHKGIVTLEVLADELIRAVEEAPDEDAADIMRSLARSDRVKILELEGQFAALKQDYSERYHREA
jgi:flagellar motility protein MotE (MotC chaperone)